VFPAAVALRVLAIDIHVYASDLVQATEHAFNKSFEFAVKFADAIGIH